MLRRNFQIIVACSQILALTALVVQYLTESSLPPELLGYLSAYETILIPDRYSVLEALTNIPLLVQTLLGILGAVGLILFRAWGRPVFLIYIGAALLVNRAYLDLMSTPAGRIFFGYLCSLTEGVTIALMYFSPIRKMFPMQVEV